MTEKTKAVKDAEALIGYAIHGKQVDGVAVRTKRSYDYYEGKHDILKRDASKGNKVINKYGEIFENRIALITETLPKWHFRPQEDADVFTADALNQIVGDVVWDVSRWEDRGEDSVDEAAHSGTSIIKTNVNRDTGYPTFTPLPNSQCYPDPKATGMDETLRFFVHAYPMAVSELKKAYKRKASGVSADPALEVTREMDESDSQASFWQASSSSYQMPSEVHRRDLKDANSPLRDVEEIGMAMVYEVWRDDDSTERIPFDVSETDNEHEQLRRGVFKPHPDENHVKHLEEHKAFFDSIDPQETQLIKNMIDHMRMHEEYEQTEVRPKYPDGRVTIICQGRELYDGPNPLPLPWRNVFTKWDFFPRRRRFWGKSLGMDLFDPQDMLNHRANSITQNINMLNNGVTLIKRGILNLKGNKSKWSNLIAKVIPVDDVSRDFKREYGPALPPHFFQDYVNLENHMERKSGHEGVAAGRFPTGSPAGVTVDQLLQQSQKPVNSVIRRYGSALKQLARNAIAIMVEFVDENERFRILNMEENQYQLIRWGDLKDRAGILNIRIDIVGQMASTRQRKFLEALQLKQHNVYDNQAVLDEIDDPKKFEVMQRMDENMQLRSAVSVLQKELSDTEKELNTMRNRMQTEDGQGNTGSAPTVRDKQ